MTVERTLPQNLEAERSILGAILIDNQRLMSALEELKAEDFHREAHAVVFSAMLALSEKGSAIDLVTLRDHLEREGTLTLVGGPAYLASLVDGVPKSAHVEYYARIVHDRASLRRLIETATEIGESAYRADEDAGEIVDRAEKAIFSIAQESLRTGFVPVKDIADKTLDMLESMSDRNEMVTGLATGFERLDEMTSGLQPGDLIILAGRPSMGKTTIGINMAENAAIQFGSTIGVFSLEMSREQLFMRMLCSQARVDSQRLRRGMLTAQEWSHLSDTIDRLSDAPIYIDDTPGVSILELRAKSRRLKSEHGLDLLVVDYLQLMKGRGRYESRQQEVSDISRSLKEIAKELNVPVIAISQLSRAPEQRGGESRKPQLSDLRESGAIEQDADVVAFIYREEVYRPDEDNRGLAQLIIGKQRNGPIGEIDLAFIKEFTRFENLEWRTDGL